MMLSRMADALYWMSRYLERADNTGRLLQINLTHLIGGGEEPLGGEQWEPLLTISGGMPIFSALTPSREIEKASVVAFLTHERAHSSSIYNVRLFMRENARIVRDMISKEMWESLNETWLFVEKTLAQPLSMERAPAFYTHVRNAVARFNGVSDGTMMAGEAYGFYRLGLFVERADMTARILDVKYHILLPSVEKVGTPLDFYQWGALLKSLSGFEAFRRLYHAGLRPIDVTEFVVFNPEFPRGLLFCAQRIENALDKIDPGTLSTESERALDNVLSLLARNDPQSAFQAGLHEFLQEFLRRMAALNDAVRSDFFESNLGGKHALPHPASNPA